MGEWVVLSRDIFDDPFFARGPMSTREALLWLASNGRIVRAHISDLAREWGVAERRAAQIIKKLERHEYISVHGGGAVRTIFIQSDLVRACGFYQTSNGRRQMSKGAGKWRGPNLSPATIQRILDRDGKKCAYCGDETGPFHIDHIKPVSRGGSDADGNLTVACRGCNLSKGGKLLKDWQAKR